MSTNQSYEERELLLKIADGDEQAFTCLFSQYHARLFQYILRLTNNREAAEELVLDVFLKLWQGRECITDIHNMNGFLFKIAYYKSLDFLRSAAKDPKFSDLIWEQSQLSDTEDPSYILIKQEYDKLLREAIALLPGQRRRVYQLNQEDGKTYRQIADELSISTNTVNMHMYEARKFIRTYLLKSLHLGVISILIALFL